MIYNKRRILKVEVEEDIIKVIELPSYTRNTYIIKFDNMARISVRDTGKIIPKLYIDLVEEDTDFTLTNLRDPLITKIPYNDDTIILRFSGFLDGLSTWKGKIVLKS